MNAEIKADWLAALRSKKYYQIEGTLKLEREDRGNNKGHCCLGVLCEIHPNLDFGGGPDFELFHEGECYGTQADLPFSVLDEIGLTKDEQDHLIFLNDTENKTFTEIADYIERKIS